LKRWLFHLRLNSFTETFIGIYFEHLSGHINTTSYLYDFNYIIFILIIKVINMLEKINWLGHSSFRIMANLIIYVDPWKVNEVIKADIILITHSHFDHMSIPDINNLIKEKTIIVAPNSAKEELSEIKCEIKFMKAGEKINVKGIPIESVPAYNNDRDYHPKSKGWLGYVIEMDGERIYFAGDTDFISEMKDLKNIDIAFLPISGTYTMDVKEAVEAALEIHPKYVIPTHYGDIIGESDDAKEFISRIRQEDPSIEALEKEKESELF
jgi:L-ascorbate metabolism protein UlaG (beta-lactamase superfamily)